MRRLDALTVQVSKRKIRIGTYYGDTPRSADLQVVEQHKWEQRGAGFVCPFLRCAACGGDLVWSRADIGQKRERLVCDRPDCGARVEEDEVILTRERMRRTPPDLLFTTAEMLNRQMSATPARPLFGMGPRQVRPPWAMLLDEAHTYSGPHGSQLALLVRRWRNEVRHAVQFVGLSATLTDPQQFFAQLVGLKLRVRSPRSFPPARCRRKGGSISWS